MKYRILIILFLFLSITGVTEASSARVLEVIEEGREDITGTDVIGFYQILKAEILEGERKGEIIILENDHMPLKKGARVYWNNYQAEDGSEAFFVSGVDRLRSIFFFVLLFVATVLLFGKYKGLRSLISLGLSIFIIFRFLIPLLLAGYSPLWVCSLLAILILIITIYTTHGFNRSSHAALGGTIIAIIFTATLSYIAILFTNLSGINSDEVLYLNMDTAGQLDLRGLLLGAIMIGALGVLDDVSIAQAYTVKELKRTATNLSKTEIYNRALNVGREHVGSLVNTLALAYVGVSLPLLLLLSLGEGLSLITLNREIIATEVIRTVVGSMGVILAVPLTTLFAVLFITDKQID